jgi:hypothetical protein
MVTVFAASYCFSSFCFLLISRLIDIKMGISEVSHNKSSNIGHLQPLSPSESSVFLETAQPSYESSVARGAQVAASNSFESSVVGGAALPFKYLLPTPHHNSNETNTIRVQNFLKPLVHMLGCPMGDYRTRLSNVQ